MKIRRRKGQAIKLDGVVVVEVVEVVGGKVELRASGGAKVVWLDTPEEVAAALALVSSGPPSRT